MSKHPKSAANTKKVWTTPSITKIDPATMPYAEMIKILHSLHDQAESELSLHPNDQQAVELEQSLRHQIDDLEARKKPNAA